MLQPPEAHALAGASPKNHSKTRQAASLWWEPLGIQKPVPAWQGLTRLVGSRRTWP